MEEMKLVQSSDFVFGYAKGDRVMVANTAEQISAFIMKHRFENVVITDFLDTLLIETSMGFLQYCINQDYLRTTLLPVLVPMQRGEVEAPEFVPYKSEDEDYIITNIRYSSGAGWYLGELIFDNGFPEPYSRITGYYPNEEAVQADFPDSISYSDALKQAREKGWIK